MADWSKLQAPLSRERDRLHGEINAIAGLMPLLMKRRNDKPWTQQDLTELRGALRRLPAIAPYVVVLVLPGSYVLLPVLAWWLDRRREQRVACNGDNQTRG